MNREKNRVLSEVMRAGDVAAVRKILAEDPDIIHVDWGDGRTWLHMAAGGGHPEVMAALVDAGLDINARLVNKAETPLHTAILLESWKVAEWLIKHGADVNAGGGNYPTPLSFASSASGNLEVVKLLVSHGAAVNTCHDHPPRNPLYLAVKWEQREIEKFLRAHGALLPAEMPEATGMKQQQKEYLHHLESHLGKLHHHSGTNDGALELWVSPPTPERDTFIMVTSGVSALVMSPPDAKMPKRIELLFELPSSWRFTGAAASEERFRWPINWVRRIAREILQKHLTIYEYNTYADEDTAKPLGPGTEMSAFLFLPELSAQGRVTLSDGQEIGLMSLYPIYEEELDCIRNQGKVTLLRAFQAARVPMLFDPARRNALAGK